MERLKSAVIIAGGEGVRLRPITNDIPKALVEVGGKPLLEWVVDWLRHSGITNLVIGVAYLKDKIIEHFGNGSKFGVHISYSVHTVEGGTGQGFKLAISRHITDDTFLALNGDQIINLNVRRMLKVHTADERTLATLAAVHPRLPFGLVQADNEGYCKGFTEKPVIRDIICSSGVYIFQREIETHLPETGDVEKKTFPLLARSRRMRVFEHNGSFITVNSLRELEEANQTLRPKHKAFNHE